MRQSCQSKIIHTHSHPSTPFHIYSHPSIPFHTRQAADAKFKEIEKILRGKTGGLEDVDEQRKYIDSLPNKINELMGDLEGTKVCVWGASGSG